MIRKPVAWYREPTDWHLFSLCYCPSVVSSAPLTGDHRTSRFYRSTHWTMASLPGTVHRWSETVLGADYWTTFAWDCCLSKRRELSSSSASCSTLTSVRHHRRHRWGFSWHEYSATCLYWSLKDNQIVSNHGCSRHFPNDRVVSAIQLFSFSWCENSMRYSCLQWLELARTNHRESACRLYFYHLVARQCIIPSDSKGQTVFNSRRTLLTTRNLLFTVFKSNFRLTSDSSSMASGRSCLFAKLEIRENQRRDE